MLIAQKKSDEIQAEIHGTPPGNLASSAQGQAQEEVQCIR